MSIEITLDKKTFSPGDLVTVDWTVVNDVVSERVYYKIKFYLNGTLIDEVDVGLVDYFEAKWGTFTFYAPDKPGTYDLKGVSYFSFDGEVWLDDDEDGHYIKVEEELVPKLEIVKDTAYTYFTINGENVGPGEYSVRKGDSVDFKITIRSVGGASGNYWVAIYDRKTGAYICYTTDSINAGETKSYTASLRVYEDVELIVAVGRGDLVGENTDDTWGC